MRTERLIPRSRREVWQSLIRHAELGVRGPTLRLALPGGISANAGSITTYESERLLECTWGSNLLRWELHALGEQTLLAFTRTETSTCPEVNRP